MLRGDEGDVLMGDEGGRASGTCSWEVKGDVLQGDEGDVHPRETKGDVLSGGSEGGEPMQGSEREPGRAGAMLGRERCGLRQRKRPT